MDGTDRFKLLLELAQLPCPKDLVDARQSVRAVEPGHKAWTKYNVRLSSGVYQAVVQVGNTSTFVDVTPHGAKRKAIKFAINCIQRALFHFLMIFKGSM